MKKIYLFSFFQLVACICFSQVAVTATAGTTTSTAYTSLQAAFDAVNAGTHQGIIAITINANTVETNTAILNASGTGSALYTSLSINPGSGPAVISGNISGPLIDLNGADNIIIDGLNNGDASLLISNTSTAPTASTIRFINDATANSIQNVAINGACTSAVSGTLVFGAGTITGNDNNLVSNCRIYDANGSFPVNAVYSAGSTIAGQENSSNTINNNHIYNFFNADISSNGILVAAGNTDWTISTNRFFQTATRTFTTNLLVHRAIQVVAGNNYTITGNVIGYAAAGGTGMYTLNGGVTTRFLAIDLAVGTSIASSVQNNTITAFSFTTSNSASSASGIWSGINITSGNVNVGTIQGNIIGSNTATGAITVNPAVAGTLTVGITSSSTGSVTITNNQIGGIDVFPAGVLSGNLLGIQAQGASGTIVITNNTIGGAIANSMRVGVAGTTTGNGLIRGILNSNAGNISVQFNTIQNLTHFSNNALAFFRAIECQQGVASITNNNINNITAYGAATSALTPEGAGILATTGSGSLVIDQNTISNLNVTNSTPTSGPVVMGIYLGSSVNGVTITRNKLYGFTNAGTSTSTTSPPIIAGVYCRDAAVSNSNILVANNMISLGNAQVTNTAIIGIWNAAASASGLTTRVFYNSVNVEGTVGTGAQPSFCYYRGDFSTAAFTTPVVELKNNSFTNSRSGGTGKHYALANSYGASASNAGGWASNASDYNVLNANTATVGYWSGDKTFSGWQATSAGDGHSLSGIGLVYENPAAGDLHLTNSVNISVDGKATPLAAVTNDFDNQNRNSTTPDIGADEFDGGTLPVTIEYFTGKKQGAVHVLNWKATCSSASVLFTIERSSDGNLFNMITGVTASQTRCLYPFLLNDNAPLPGNNYYRLKMTESDGAVTYSRVITILNQNNSFEVTGLTPTLVNQYVVLHTKAVQDTRLTIIILDVAGRILSTQKASVTNSSAAVRINVDTLTPGTYELTCLPDHGRAQTFRFIKH